MIQTNADIVPGDSGGPLASSAGVIGMDTAGNDAGDQQGPAAGFAIPIDTALSVARQIAAGHASSVITVGYPPFLGIFIGSGSSSNPQTQAQQQDQQNGGSGGSGSTPGCYTSNADLTVPSAHRAGQLRHPDRRDDLREPRGLGRPDRRSGHHGGERAGGRLARRLCQDHDTIPPGDTISVTWVSPSGQRTTSSLHLTAGPPQ